MRKRNFTLVEMLVVVAIIAVLLAMLAPALHKSVEQSRRVVCLNNMFQMGIELTRYAHNNNGKLPLFYSHYQQTDSNRIWACMDGNPRGIGWTSELANSGAYGGFVSVGKVYLDGGLQDGSITVCPSNTKAHFDPAKWPTPYWKKSGCPPYHGGYANTTHSMGYFVRPAYQAAWEYKNWTSVDKKYPRLKKMASKAILTDNTVIWDMATTHRDGMNVLYGDGAGRYAPLEVFYDNMLAINNGSMEYIWWKPRADKCYNWNNGKESGVWADLDNNK